MENLLFPVHPVMHISLAILAFFVFGMQFIRLRKKYHLLLAIAIPCSLLPYVVEGRTFFYTMGVIEIAVLLVALVLAKTVDRDKKSETEESAS